MVVVVVVLIISSMYICDAIESALLILLKIKTHLFARTV